MSRHFFATADEPRVVSCICGWSLRARILKDANRCGDEHVAHGSDSGDHVIVIEEDERL
jgi:hypothetical protein